jgi:stearoyl-CoA desaturase (delta-9 desaturase)
VPVSLGPQTASALTLPKAPTARRVGAWIGTFLGVTLPVLGVAAAGVLLWGRGFGWLELGLLAVMYLLSGLGVTVGFHRLFTHKAFQTTRPVRAVLGVLGSMAFEGPLLSWVARHRLHHQHSDGPDDPHSPHGRGGLRGFFHAHVGWAFAPDPADLERYAGDLARDPLLRAVSALFPLWAGLGLAVPAAIGYAADGWPGALAGFVWGGLVRVFLIHHATWSVNSVCHLWGSRPYRADDESRNNVVVGVMALGEGWHNNHHAFPSSARHGLAWWQLDVSYVLIRAMAVCGLAWRVRVPTAAERSARAR